MRAMQAVCAASVLNGVWAKVDASHDQFPHVCIESIRCEVEVVFESGVLSESSQFAQC